MLIARFYRRYKNSRFGLALSLCCLVLPFLLLSGDNIAPFIGIIVGVIVIHKLYGRRSLFPITIIGTVTAILLFIVMQSKLVLMESWRGATGVALLAQMFHNYVPGFENFAATLELPKDEVFSTLFYDLYYTIPFKNTLFGLEGEYIQDIYEQYTLTGGQIVPFTGQLTYYLGILAIPIVALFVKLAYNLEKKSKETSNFWFYFFYMYFSLFTALSLSIYSVSIYLRGLVNVVLPVYIIMKVSGIKNARKSGFKVKRH